MHRPAALVVVLLLAAPLTGCASNVTACADHLVPAKAQNRYDVAEVVVVGTLAETDRTVEPDAVYRVHRLQVERVVRGGPLPAAIDVYALSDQCITYGRDAEYIEPDPLDGLSRAVVHLAATPHDGAYSLYVPGTVDALPAGASLPFSTTPSLTTNTTPSN